MEKAQTKHTFNESIHPREGDQRGFTKKRKAKKDERLLQLYAECSLHVDL